jgi:superkiller protein 3
MSIMPQTPDELFDKAERLEDSGDESGALFVWRQLANERPYDAGVFCRLGRVARRLGDVQEAQLAFRQAIQLDVATPSAHFALASIALALGEYREAESCLMSGLRFEKNEAAYCMLGVALERLGRRQEARASYLAALEIDPAFDEAYYNLGVLLRENDPAESEALFRRALECTPDYPQAHRELGWRLRARNALPEAESHLRRAIDLDPDDAWAHVYLGNTLWARADIAQAIAEYDRARESEPNRAFPLWSLANLHEDRKEWKKAQDLYERALELEPDDLVANMNLGRMFKKKGEPTAAKLFLERALLLDPGYEPARTLLAGLERSEELKPGGKWDALSRGEKGSA